MFRETREFLPIFGLVAFWPDTLGPLVESVNWPGEIKPKYGQKSNGWLSLNLS